MKSLFLKFQIHTKDNPIKNYYLLLAFVICFAQLQAKRDHSSLIETKQFSSSKDLARTKKKKEQEIKRLKSEINSLIIAKADTRNSIKKINRKIEIRLTLIDQYKQSLNIINRQIDNKKQIIKSTETKIEEIKRELRLLIVGGYKEKIINSTSLAFIAKPQEFAQQNLKSAWIGYIDKKSSELFNQLEVSKKMAFNQAIDLNYLAKEKKTEITDFEGQKENLVQDQREKTEIIQNIDQKQNSLEHKLKKSEQESQKLNDEIKNAIQKEFELARKKANTNPKFKTDKGNKAPKKEKEEPIDELSELNQTPESLKLSKIFANNQTYLPWPVERGYIQEHFGRHEHPEYKNVIINNNGTKFNTPNGSQVRAIFEGEVRYVLPMPNGAKFILLKHGQYFTVYSNLETVIVKPGQNIKSKQVIGSVGRGSNSNASNVELQIWEGCCKKLNPEKWILKR
jgi:septal ring factor EnvC (AmiA/AmiB activator)